MEIIPVADYPTYSEELTIENVLYRFKISYNERGQHWALTIMDSNEVILIAGVKIVLGYELIKWYPDRGLPPGGIMVINMDDSVTEITRDNLGTDIKIVYIPEAELAAIQ